MEDHWDRRIFAADSGFRIGNILPQACTSAILWSQTCTPGHVDGSVHHRVDTDVLIKLHICKC